MLTVKAHTHRLELRLYKPRGLEDTQAKLTCTVHFSNLLILPAWGFPALHARLVPARFRAGGVWDGLGETPARFFASPIQERSDPGGLDAAASACHSTHGTRTQPPEGHRGATGNKRRFIRYIS